ncbi:MAG: Fic family protein [Acidimicrobiaceae bacterium]|nr:Fic family protein [Acidimicrobiia bacterium]MCY4495392.1 Fic family protein [Acidimicrobiaceae bacterium]
MRDYEESHPWITFKATDVNNLPPRTWMLLGEARAICEQISSTPLLPTVAQDLNEVALIKGAQATTAIEGNTLNEDQVAGIYRGTYTAPPSRAYQQREVCNVLDALTDIDQSTARGTLGPVTADLICGYNRGVLDGIEHTADVRPGEFRHHSVMVGNYRGAPAQDCRYLTKQLAAWLESDIFSSNDPETDFALTVAQAVYAHLYIAWIHPFGDGNGRTARLLEFMLLARSGQVPLLAAHLLSNHYNLTRDRYYRELEGASQSGSTGSFVSYAAQGLVDGLREQINVVRVQQLAVSWTNYVNETMDRFPTSKASDRQRSLVLAMPSSTAVPQDGLIRLTPDLASLYALTGPRTLSRDLNRLLAAGLILREGRKWKANTDVMFTFMPPAAPS